MFLGMEITLVILNACGKLPIEKECFIIDASTRDIKSHTCVSTNTGRECRSHASFLRNRITFLYHFLLLVEERMSLCSCPSCFVDDLWQSHHMILLLFCRHLQTNYSNLLRCHCYFRKYFVNKYLYRKHIAV